MKQFDSILNSKNLHKSLCEHFSYLAGNDFKPLLSAIMEKATGVRVKDDKLVVTFEEDEDNELYASPPGDVVKYSNWPKSFQDCVRRHEYLSFGGESWGVCLGNRRSFDFKSKLLKKYEEKDILCPVSDDVYSNWWVYHPEEKNGAGENMIYFYKGDESKDIESPNELSAAEIFLKEMALNLYIDLDV
jgi:hypothetical protein